MVMIFGFAAVVIDLGAARDIRREAQVASDASALGGAGVLYNVEADGTYNFGRAVDKAKQLATLNYGTTEAQWVSCSDPGNLGHSPAGETTASTQCISFDSSSNPKKIRVKVPDVTSPTYFAGVIGQSGPSVSGAAEVTLNPAFIGKCALCVVDVIQPNGTTTGDVLISGGGSLYASGGTLNGNNSEITVLDDGTVEFTNTPDIRSGSDPFSGMDPANVKYPTGQPVQDPFAEDPNVPPPPDFNYLGLTLHDSGTLKSCDTGSTADSLAPGRYNSINFPKGPCTLEDGLYVITGELSLDGQAEVDGQAVTLFFTCGTADFPRPCAEGGEEGGELDLSGRGTFNVEEGFIDSLATDITGEEVTDKKYVVIYDRENTSPLTVSGNAGAALGDDADADSIGGIIYARAAEGRIDGGGSTGYFNVEGQVVLNVLTLNGNGTLISIVDNSLGAVFKYPATILTK
jgi:hypothetical protein